MAKTYAEYCLEVASNAVAGPWNPCFHLKDAKNDKKCQCDFPGDISGGDGELVVCTIGPHCPEVVIGNDMVPRYDRKQELANAKFIVSSREMVPELAERLQRACGKLREVIEYLPSHNPFQKECFDLLEEFELMPR